MCRNSTVIHSFCGNHHGTSQQLPFPRLWVNSKHPKGGEHPNEAVAGSWSKQRHRARGAVPLLKVQDGLSSESSSPGINGLEIPHDWNWFESTNMNYSCSTSKSFGFMVAALGRLVISGAKRSRPRPCQVPPHGSAQELIMLSCSSAMATRLKSSFPALGHGVMTRSMLGRNSPTRGVVNSWNRWNRWLDQLYQLDVTVTLVKTAVSISC